MPDYARYLAGLLDQLSVDRAHIAGLSWGGVLAQEFYRLFQDRVLSLVLADSSVGGGGLSPAAREERIRARLSPLETRTPAEMARSMAPTFLSPRARPDLVRDVESIAAEIRPDGYRSAVLAFMNADQGDILPNVRVPTLVIRGDDDGIASRSQSLQLRDGIRGSVLVSIPGAGHFSNQERPDLFNRAVLDFLARLAIPSQPAPQ
jgi:pimeloyl-ACP methyl ester carboxylesterase